jgi:hypothetical protein
MGGTKEKLEKKIKKRLKAAFHAFLKPFFFFLLFYCSSSSSSFFWFVLVSVGRRSQGTNQSLPIKPGAGLPLQ